jgi:proton-coupled amino acid transporter
MLHYKGVAKTRFWKVADVILCVFGLIVMVYTTTLTVMSWADGDAEPRRPGHCDKEKLRPLFRF